MKRNHITGALFLFALLLLSFITFAKQGKVIQIFRNGEVIKQYPLEYIDYIEVNDIDSTSGRLPGGFDLPENPTQAMLDSLEKIYAFVSGDTDSPAIMNWYIPSFSLGIQTFHRALFNLEEIPTDETKWLWWHDDNIGPLNLGEISDSSLHVLAAYHTLTKVIEECNKFINKDFGLEFIENKYEQSRALRKYQESVRQAKILRSGMYFSLISEFGNVPYADENTEPGSVAPQLSSDMATGRRLVTQRVIDTLEDLVAWYKANDPDNKPEYGRLGLDAAEALLVRFYLNHEVFTGTPAWDKCLHHAKAIIARRGRGGFNNSGLAMNYSQNFSYNNRTAADNEIIWRLATIDSKGKKIYNWANGFFMLVAFTGNDGYPNANGSIYNTTQGWKCLTGIRQLVDAFEWNADYTESPDQRTAWWRTAKHGFAVDNDVILGDEWGKNGFLPIKFTNWNINDDGSIDRSDIPAQDNPSSIDYGVIRLAEIYLSAAEAILNGGGGSTADALTYTNFVRERAGMPAYSSLTKEELQKERQRELYTESTRRTDLIRYGKWISGYNWNWKGRVKTGTDYDPAFIVYPLPASVVEECGYAQNPKPAEPLPTDDYELFYDDEMIYLVGSPQDMAEPTMSNLEIFKDYRIYNTSRGSKIYEKWIELPPHPVFYFCSTLKKDNQEFFGVAAEEKEVKFDYAGEGEIKADLVKGKGMISLPDFEGGIIKITVDLRDSSNMSVTLDDTSYIYIIGNITDPVSGQTNNWLAPIRSNREWYDKYFRLNNVKGKGEIYSGQFYLEPKEYSYEGGAENLDNFSQFRFFTDLLGWSREASIGASWADFTVVSIADEVDAGYSGYTRSEGLGNWGIYCEERIPLTIVVDLEKNKIYVKKGFHEISFSDGEPVFE